MYEFQFFDWFSFDHASPLEKDTDWFSVLLKIIHLAAADFSQHTALPPFLENDENES